MVDICQGFGVYVMCIFYENDSEEEQLFSSDVGLFEIFQVCQLLESNIVVFVVKMVICVDIDNLKWIIEQEQWVIVFNDIVQDNVCLFYLVFVGVMQNQMLLVMVEWIWLQMDSSLLWQQFNVYIVSCVWWLKWFGDWQILFVVLWCCDVMGVWQVMWQYLENVKNSLLELFDEDVFDFDGYLFDLVLIFQGKLV